jgi:hypothetical protein
MTRTQWLVGILLWLVTVAGLSIGHRQVGYVRDEGIYFVASRSYAGWVETVATDPTRLSDSKLRDRAFAINREHPALLKTLGGLSARLLARPIVLPEDPSDADHAAAAGGWIPVLPEGAAMRLPAQLLAGLGVALLFWTGCRWGGAAAGVLAAGWFILLPRVWFHAGLHAFDVPVAVAGLVVSLAYLRSLRERRWGWLVGPLLGVAIAIKHNALFLGPLLAVHLWATLAWKKWRRGEEIPIASFFALPLWSMAVAGPLVAWLLWPWMWDDTAARLLEYFEFHRQHSWYNMEFLGRNHNQPPMPITYPVVMTWATVPTVLLVLGAIGMVSAWIRPAKEQARSGSPRGFWTPLAIDDDRGLGLWLALLGAFPIVLISLPSTPIFGGTKHWITAYPFWALAAALGWRALWHRARWGTPALRHAALAVVLTPAALSTVDGHPFGLSQYAPLVGGPRGAADLGLCRGFWGHAVLPLVPEVEPVAGDRGTVYLHDLHVAAQQQYLREGRWPSGVVGAAPRNARAALLFHELHMTADEIEVWNALGSRSPTAIVTLDDVPLTSLYARPR